MSDSQSHQEAKVLPIVYHLLTAFHAQIVEGLVYIFVKGAGWLHGKDAIDRVIVGLDPTTTIRDRSEVRDLLAHMAPEGKLADVRFIGFANGDLDIRTMTLLSMSPARIVVCRLPWNWNPSARSSAVEKYLESLANGDRSTFLRIEEMLGAVVYRGKLFLIFVIVGAAPFSGGSASNGKSSLIKVMSVMVGQQNCCMLSLADYGVHFMTSNLRGALLAGSTDTGAGDSNLPAASVEVVKKVAAQDQLTVDVKFAPEAVTFTPLATPVVAGNQIPHELAADDGLRDRIAPIVLTNRFPRTTIGPEDRLNNAHDMEALLVHAVTGLRRILAQGGLTPSADATKFASRLAAKASTVLRWVKDGDLTEANLEGTTCAEAYDQYCGWAKDSGTLPLSKSDFESELQGTLPGLEVRKCRWKGATPQRRWMTR